MSGSVSPNLFAHWFPLIEELIVHPTISVVCHVQTLPASSSFRECLKKVCRQAGARLETRRTLEPGEKILADLLLLEVEPSWYAVHHHLELLPDGRSSPFPITLVPHLGAPHGRRDGYFEPPGYPGTTPVEQRHRHRPAGAEPSRSQAVLEHAYRNGCLTAVEDFVRDAPHELRFVRLPGFHDLGVLAPQRRVSEHSFLDRLLRHPGDVLLDLGLIAALETARRRTEPTPGGGEEDLEVLRADVRRLSSMLLRLWGMVLDLLESSRWKWGNRLGDLYLLLRRRPRPETVEPPLRQLLEEVKGWNLHEKLLSGRTAVLPADAERTEPCDSLEPESHFHRFLRRLDLDSADAASLASSESIVESMAREELREMPLVSVILPTHNRAGLLVDSVRSVQEQTYVYWELVICDDGSEDDTQAVVQDLKDSRIRYFKIPHSGAAVARNRALEEAGGELIAYLDSDNLWHPRFLQITVSVLMKRPSYAAAFSRYVDVTMEDDSYRLRVAPPCAFDYDRLLEANYIDLNCLVHRRELYDLLGGFDDGLRRQQDWDLVLKYGYVTDLLPVEPLLTIYRRNPEWSQITSTEDGESARRRVRAKASAYVQSGGPRRAPAAHEPVLLVLAETARERRVAALARALGRSREVRQSSLAEALETDSIPRCLERGEVVYVLGPEDLESFPRPAAGRETGVLLHEVDQQVSSEPPAGRYDSVPKVLVGLTPSTLPVGYHYLPPCLPSSPDRDVGWEPVALASAIEEASIVLCLGQERSWPRHRELEAELRQALPGELQVCHRDLPATVDAVIVTALEDAPLDEEVLIVLLEAFQRGVPVLGTPRGPLCPPIDWGCIHGVYEPGAAGFANALRRLLHHRTECRRLVERAHRWFDRRFSANAMELAFELLVSMARADLGPEGVRDDE